MKTIFFSFNKFSIDFLIARTQLRCLDHDFNDQKHLVEYDRSKLALTNKPFQFDFCKGDKEKNQVAILLTSLK
jgi:hypothetical protein